MARKEKDQRKETTATKDQATGCATVTKSKREDTRRVREGERVSKTTRTWQREKWQ